jgi:hypothetical protein
MNQETINILIWVSPLIIGGIIAAVNSDDINNATEKAEAWTRKTQSKVSKKKNLLNRYLINPVLYTLVVFSNWTDSFKHCGIKNGVRVAATLYLIAAWCFLIYAAFMVVLFLVITAVVIYVAIVVIGALLNGSNTANNDFRTSFEKGRRIVGPVGAGKRINQETGRIEKDGLFGWNETDERIDPDTGNIQTEGFFGWQDSDTRINQETGNIQKDGFFGYSDSDTRINPETGIIQKNGIFGWADTDERINTETGRRQKNGIFGWNDE